MVKKGIFYGWWVMLALFFIEFISPMGRYSLTALSPAIQQELGWSKSQIGLAFSIHLWTYGWLVLLVGWLVDRIGSRRVFFVGGIVLIVALTLLSNLNSLWQLYFFYGAVVALGVSMTHFVPTQATSRKWFIRRAGLAGGIILSAVGVGTAVLAPILTTMANSLGWRTTWLICAISFGAVIMLLAALVIRNTPESIGLHPDGATETPSTTNIGQAAIEIRWTAKEALRTPQFWLLFISLAMGGFPLQGIMTQIVMWGVDLGAPLATAGIFMTAFSLPSTLGNVLGGWLGDRYGKRRILVWANAGCLLVALGAGLLVNSRGSLLIFALIFGISTGMQGVLYIPFAGDLYGRAALGTLAGVLIFGATLSGGLGPLTWASIADATGSYNSACLLSAGLYALSTIAAMLIKPEKLSKRQ